MKYLLDTHILIWALEDNERLSIDARKIIDDENNAIFISIASIWEMAIKISRGKLVLSKTLEDIIESLEKQNVYLLTIQPSHILKLLDLPFHHNDPFDRIIIAQGIVEDFIVVTNDGFFKCYDVPILE
jgi:PIN domain nuclease of toxin-antitoxin system